MVSFLDFIDLSDESGSLKNLQSHPLDYGTKYLNEREILILVKGESKLPFFISVTFEMTENALKPLIGVITQPINCSIGISCLPLVKLVNPAWFINSLNPCRKEWFVTVLLEEYVLASVDLRKVQSVFLFGSAKNTSNCKSWTVTP